MKSNGHAPESGTEPPATPPEEPTTPPVGSALDFQPPETAGTLSAGEDPPMETAGTIEKAVERAKINKNRKGEPAFDRTKKFFDLVRSIPEEDWGEAGRAVIYVYITMPICNLKQENGAKFFRKYVRPIYDIDSIAESAGSCEGYMQLNWREAGANRTTVVDTYNFSIIDPERPCKIPYSLWFKDPRNTQWLGLLPKEEQDKANRPPAPPPQPKQEATPLREVTGALGAIVDLSEKLADRQNPSKQDESASILNVAKALKELSTPPQAPHNDGMMTVFMPMFMKMLETAERRSAEAEKRSEALLLKLLDMKAAPQQNGNGVFGQLKEMAEGLKTISELDMFGGGEKGNGLRGWQGVVSNVLEETAPGLVDVVKTIATGFMIAQQSKAAAAATQARTVSPAPQQTQEAVTVIPQVIPAPQPAQQQQPGLRAIDPLKSLADAIKDGLDGKTFAQDLENIAPELYAQAAKFNRDQILAMVQAHPVWGELAEHQARLPQFIDDFLAWDKEAGEEEPSHAKPQQPPPPLPEETQESSYF